MEDKMNFIEKMAVKFAILNSYKWMAYVKLGFFAIFMIIVGYSC